MSNWNNLPVEILAEIMGLVLDNDKTKAFMLRCMLVSKHWSMVSRTIIYKSVTLRKSSQFEPFVTSMLHSSNGQLVKQIQLSYDDEYQLELNLGRLFKFCPNITSLEQPRYKKSSFFAKLLLEVLAGNGTKLRRIPPYDSSDPDDIRVYGHVTYALKDTLEDIYLSDYFLTKITFEQNNTLNELQMYKSLKSICFKLESHSNLFTVLEKIQYCYSLISVRILADWDDDVEKHLGIVEPLHLQSLSNVRYLQISKMLTISSTLVQYVLRLFPNLKSLEYADDYSQSILHNNRVQRLSAEEWGHFKTQGMEIPNELWIQFLTYVASMRVCTIPYLFVKDVEVFAKVPNLYENLHISADEWLPELDKDFKVYFGIFYNTNDKSNIRSMYQKDNYTPHIVLKCDRKTHFVNCPKKNTIKTLGSNLKASDFDAGSQGDAIIPLDVDIKNSVEDNLRFIFENQDSVKPIRSLGRIQFRYCEFDEDYLCQLSSRLPSTLQFVAFIDSFVHSHKFHSSLLYDVIDMPNTSFSTLLWKSEISYEPASKVSMNNQLVVSSSIEFEASIVDDVVQTIDIRCFDIKRLVIKLPGLRFLLHPEEPPIICDDDSGMDVDDFSVFYSDF
ncbi:hypothetical protein INT47_002446 [Mucor saturninus]|uniref:F-box domain-containing protein n=1 Tax=Mucor saturninus TaxID=64648 RepID=A0A8H7VDI0_9FUNG|nr:hypothetical protein INT47_002446 [Mucor saturninus]